VPDPARWPGPEEPAMSLRPVLFAALILFAPLARAGAPSPESVERLMEVMRTPHQLEVMFQVMENGFETGLQSGLRGRKLSAADQRQVDELRQRISRDIREALSWEALKPIYARIYQAQLDQEEVDAMVAFYGTALGQSILDKMPAIMQAASTEMQERTGPLQRKMVNDMQEAMGKLSR
jgi:uncharacterized protein